MKKAQDAAKSDAPKVVKSAPAEVKAAAPVVPKVDPSAPKTKEQKLAELLEMYKKDSITAQEYHQRRAKLLSEP